MRRRWRRCEGACRADERAAEGRVNIWKGVVCREGFPNFTFLMLRLSFSGHETFHCRPFWLKKGYDHILQGNTLRDDDAIALLGVGRNMLSSMNFWLQAFGLLEDGKRTPLATFLLESKEGKDPFLENPASLWLLHYHLVATGYASIYHIVFNRIKENQVEFEEAYLEQFIKSLLAEEAKEVGDHTIRLDITVFRRTYTRPRKVESPDEDLNSLLHEISLVKIWPDKDEPSKGKKSKERHRVYIIDNQERPSLPYQLVLYAIARQMTPGAIAISFQEMLMGDNGPGKLFALSPAGLMQKIDEITHVFRDIVYKSDGGIQTLTFNDPGRIADPLTLLEPIYG